VKATLHWVSAEQSVPAEVRLYGHLFTKEDPDEVAEGHGWRSNLDPRSLETLTGCRLEPALAGLPVEARVQFERLGYFCVDPDSKPGAPVFNRTLTLRDEWARLQQKGKPA
jgi:glutaminyl-tRNA synthetase